MATRQATMIPFFTTLLDSCFTTKNLEKLKQIHAKTIITGISRHDFIRSKLISSYSSCSQLHQASIIFSYTNRQSTFLFNTLIRSYSNIGYFSDSLDLFRKMTRDGKRIDRHTLPAVLKACAGIPALWMGDCVHLVMIRSGFDSDVVNLNALVTMYGKCDKLGYARKVFDEMSYRNVVTFSAMMNAYGIHGKCNEVFEVFERMVNDGVEPDEVTFTGVLTACSHKGFVDKGVEYFVMMTERFGVKPSLEHYTCMVDMLGRAGRVEEAEMMVEEMDGVPDEVLWSALLAACKKHRKVEVAERLAEKIYGRQLVST
uniref:pentatricopeptide repeat-containing protein At3g46790, chloroplastic-like n=1 Tax=Erigeron canadensis TaxID=72917 RepID=UPI001CB9B900|nr:pentatricopeptide repeat-containing protein At3g46790, chloroplastic-like [Erigeron canadensis]